MAAFARQAAALAPRCLACQRSRFRSSCSSAAAWCSGPPARRRVRTAAPRARSGFRGSFAVPPTCRATRGAGSARPYSDRRLAIFTWMPIAAAEGSRIEQLAQAPRPRAASSSSTRRPAPCLARRGGVFSAALHLPKDTAGPPSLGRRWHFPGRRRVTRIHGPAAAQAGAAARVRCRRAGCRVDSASRFRRRHAPGAMPRGSVQAPRRWRAARCSCRHVCVLVGAAGAARRRSGLGAPVPRGEAA